MLDRENRPARPRIGLTEIRSALDRARSGAERGRIRRDALLAAVTPTRPMVARDGPVEVEITSVQPHGDNAVRVRAIAVRGGQIITGFDTDHVIVNPPYDYVTAQNVTEDPMACLKAILLGYARAAR